jgi:hypothetical protein
MMRFPRLLYSLAIIAVLYSLAVYNAGCAQIGMPTGGPKDSIPPRLVSASPSLEAVNVTSTKITLTFNEYVDLKDPQTNVLISPFPKRNPSVDYKLKTITVKLKDSLLPNTTYSINFGNAIVDNNEGNPLKGFTYVFSTGPAIDSFMLDGRVIIAETGKTDSTLVALLYRNTDDSAVQKYKPDYVARLNGDGSFRFVNLPAGDFKVYALLDGDGGKTYNSKKEMFAFTNTTVKVSAATQPVLLYASAIEKEKLITTPPRAAGDKKLKYTLSPSWQYQDLEDPFGISFSKPLKRFDTSRLVLTDSNRKQVSSAVWSIDSSRTKIKLTHKWTEDMSYRLILDSAAVSDSSNNTLAKTDTIRFFAKKETDYGNVVLRFINLDLTKHPVLQFVQGEEVMESHPLTRMEWSKKLMRPGEYELRILFDENNNGRWDPGDYSKKLQPERVIPLTQKLAVKANWDNERDIKL